MKAYYNEIDLQAAQWLQNLMDAGEIPEGEIDTRSIKDVRGRDLRGFDQCHFFAGIGGWALALKLAGWGDRHVWTGSCPCQPFSCAGKGKGEDDARHLWPDFARLIRECKPPIIFGEQVASKDALSWLDGVFSDLEGASYSCGAADLCAAGIGAPHIRQRLYWVANANFGQGEQSHRYDVERGRAGDAEQTGMGRDSCRLANAEHPIAGSGIERIEGCTGQRWDRPAIDGIVGGLGNSQQPGLEGHSGNEHEGDQPGWIGARPDGPTTPAGAWSDYCVVPCLDGKSRRLESGSPAMAHGIPRIVGPLLARMGGLPADARASIKRARANRNIRLKGYGNAIVPELAAEFIRACMEALDAN